jgi:hypothetical protein
MHVKQVIHKIAVNTSCEKVCALILPKARGVADVPHCN